MYEYKEDSTRGKNPRIDPKSYKPDVLVQVWVEARKLVMLNQWLDKNGFSTRFMSEIVRNTIDVVVDQLLLTGEVEKIEFNQIARDILQHRYNRDNLNPRGRGDRNVVHNLHLDNIRRESLSSSSDQEFVSGINKPVQASKGISDDEWERVQKRIQEDKRQEAKECSNHIKYDENGLAIINRERKDSYTEKDRQKDLDKKTKSEAEMLLEEIAKDHNVDVKKGVVRPLDNRPRPLTEEELREKEEKLKAKDQAEKDAWDSFDPRTLKPSADQRE